MNFELKTTSQEDIAHIAGWIAADPWHKDEIRNDPQFLMTGKGLLTFCVADEKGVVCYVRLDREGDFARVATQFGPESEVSKKRVVLGLARTMLPAIKQFARLQGLKGLIYESINPSLIAFCEQQGFVAVGNNDHVWPTEDRTACA